MPPLSHTIKECALALHVLPYGIIILSALMAAPRFYEAKSGQLVSGNLPSFRPRDEPFARNSAMASISFLESMIINCHLFSFHSFSSSLEHEDNLSSYS